MHAPFFDSSLGACRVGDKCLDHRPSAGLRGSAAISIGRGRVVLADNVRPVAYTISITPNAKTLSFSGQVDIDIEVRRATRTIEVNAADLELLGVTLDGSGEAPTVAIDQTKQVARFIFAVPVTPGRHRLAIVYSGKIYQQSSGLFALDYDTPHGKERSLFTQFETSDARRFVPCFDEPELKATFNLSATVPADLVTISNMPIVSSTPLPRGLKRVQFSETPKMSTYLLFFGLGDFQRVSRTVAGVDVGVIVKRGDTAKAGYALDVAIVDLRLNAPHVQVSLVMPGHVGTSIIDNTVAEFAPDLDDLAREAVLERAEAFRNRGLTPDQAAEIILNGVRERRWRILVGPDAEALDTAVRAAPEDAYGVNFYNQLPSVERR